MRQEMKSTSKRGAGGSTVTNMQDKNKVHKRDKNIKKRDKRKRSRRVRFRHKRFTQGTREADQRGSCPFYRRTENSGHKTERSRG